MNTILTFTIGIGTFVLFGWTGVIVIFAVTAYAAVMVGLNYVWEEWLGFR